MRAREFITAKTKPIIREYKREITLRNPNLRQKLVEKEWLLNRTYYTGRIQRERHTFMIDLLKFMSNHGYTQEQMSNVAKTPSESLGKVVRSLPEQLQQEWIKEISEDGYYLLINAFGEVQTDIPKFINHLADDFERLDPTYDKQTGRGGLYIPWLFREYANDNIHRREDLEPYSAYLKIYHANKNRRGFPPEAKDIMRITAQQLRDVARRFDPNDPQNRRSNLGEYTVLYGQINVTRNEDGIPVVQQSGDIVVRPRNEDAAIYWGTIYGGKSEWCTAYIPPQTNRFEYYNNSGPLYIIIPQDPTRPNEKYQLHFKSQQFMNEDDDEVPLMWLLRERFPELLDEFLHWEPSMHTLVSFVSDNVIDMFMKHIKPVVMNAVNDEIDDLESKDSGWDEYRYDLAQTRGYVDSDGGIDWEQTHDDPDFDYSKYYVPAAELLETATSLVKLSAQEIKQIIAENPESGLGDMEITEFTDVLYRILAAHLETTPTNFTRRIIRNALSYINISVVNDAQNSTKSNKETVRDPETEITYAINV